MAYDVLVLGGGSAGCVLASRLSEDPDRTVCLVEAGPDYGRREGGRWPGELLDPGGIPDTHEWDPSESPYAPLRARVLAGCSAHNACILIRGPDADYDGWGAGWTANDLEPCFERALATIAPQPHMYGPEGFSPWFAGVVAGCGELGLPLLGDLNDPPEALGVGTGPYNIVDGVRWNAAFAYLDPARSRPNLTIRGDLLVDRVVLEGSRAVGALAGGELLRADLIVLAAGACGSPAILLRSGVGPEDDLAALGIDVVEPLMEVGANLSDHGSAKLAFEPTDTLRDATRARAPVPFSNGLVKAATAGSEIGLDVHLLPVTSRVGDSVHVTVALLQPHSRGWVKLRSPDSGVSPEIEHRLLSDPDGRDRAVLRAGLELARELAATEPLQRLGRPLTMADEERIDTTAGIYFHPVGTCALGSVLDRHARVMGFDNLYVADASIMPTIPRANTHLSVLAIAERVAEML